MEQLVEMPKTQVIMAFVATCIEATARLLNTSYKEVYQRMKRVGLLDYVKTDDDVFVKNELERQFVLDNSESEEVKGIIMSNRIGAISVELAKRLDIAPARALQLFYESKTCADLHDKATGLYLYGDLYIVDEVIRELQK